MRTYEQRIGDLSVSISVNSDWSGDAYVKIGRWRPWPESGGERYLGGRELPPMDARELLAGRLAPCVIDQAPDMSHDEWGAVVAAAVFSATFDGAVSVVVEGVRPPWSRP